METSGQEALKINSERRSRYYHKKLEEQSIIKKASYLLSQNRKLSLEENGVVRRAEKIKDKQLKRRQERKQYYQKRKAEPATEETEAMKLKRCEQRNKNRQAKREKEESILKKAMELLSQSQELTLEQKEMLRKTEEIKVKRLKMSTYFKQYAHDHKTKAMAEQKEARRLKRSEHAKLEKEKTVFNQAMALSEQKHELSLEENDIVRKAEEIKAMRLKNREDARKYRHIRKSAATPEEIESTRLKRSEYYKRRLQKRKSAATPEEIETMSFKELERRKQWRLNRKAAATPEEIEAMKLKKSEENRRYQLKKKATREKNKAVRLKSLGQATQHQEISSDEREILTSTGKILEDQLRKNDHTKQLTMKKSSGKLSKEQVFDEIKIEKEVIQETRINAIPANYKYLLDLQEGCFNDSSCSWLDHSEKKFMTGKTNTNHSSFQSFQGGCLKKFFNGMRVLIDATAKQDGLAIFGKQVAQKLRCSNKNVAEVNFAKQLIDEILKNFAAGAYSIDTKIL